MILKEADDKVPGLVRLEALLKSGRIPPDRADSVQRTLRIAHAGIKGERESAYQIDFYARDSTRTAVIHDLRLELSDGRVAQIDHLLIHHTYRFYVLETKHFSHGLKITEEGEFLRWNDFRRNYEGIASPIEQNKRHALVLKKVIESLGLPEPTIRSLILVSDKARVDRPKRFDSSMVVKADQVFAALDKDLDSANALGIIGGFIKSARQGHVEEIGNKLVALHKPIQPDYLAALGIVLLPMPSRSVPQHQEHPSRTSGTPVQIPPPARDTPAPTITPLALNTPAATIAPRASDRAVVPVSSPGARAAASPKAACKQCGGSDLNVFSGRYGYYFRCTPCQVNTAIKTGCGHEGHNERLRKAGTQFFRECAACGTSALFWENKTELSGLPARP